MVWRTALCLQQEALLIVGCPLPHVVHDRDLDTLGLAMLCMFGADLVRS